MRKNGGRILFGIFLIALAVFVILGALGIGFKIPGDIQVWQWILGVLLLIWMVERIKELSFVGMFLALGFEIMVFKPQIGRLFGFENSDWISNWVIFLASLLIGVGLSMIFKGASFMTVKIKRNKLGSTVKYIDCAEFKEEKIENKMGAIEVRFANVCELTEDVKLEIKNTMGETVVYIPAEWRINFSMTNILGEVNLDDAIKSQTKNKDAEHALTLKLHNKLGEIRVISQE